MSCLSIYVVSWIYMLYQHPNIFTKASLTTLKGLSLNYFSSKDNVINNSENVLLFLAQFLIFFFLEHLIFIVTIFNFIIKLPKILQTTSSQNTLCFDAPIVLLIQFLIYYINKYRLIDWNDLILIFNMNSLASYKTLNFLLILFLLTLNQLCLMCYRSLVNSKRQFNYL